MTKSFALVFMKNKIKDIVDIERRQLMLIRAKVSTKNEGDLKP